MANLVRVCVYEMKDGSKEVQELRTKEEEQHERASAEREVHDPKSYVNGYHFEWREKEKKA